MNDSDIIFACQVVGFIAVELSFYFIFLVKVKVGF